MTLKRVRQLINKFQNLATRFDGFRLDPVNFERLISNALDLLPTIKQEERDKARDFLYTKFLLLNDQENISSEKIITIFRQLLSHLYYNDQLYHGLVRTKIEDVVRDESKGYKVTMSFLFGPSEAPLLGQTVTISFSLPSFLRFYSFFKKIKGNRIDSSILKGKSFWARLKFDGFNGFSVAPVKL